ncbi:hypothetical protein HHK36_031274 [Tetracentron sinense]|uniref:FHA domain-containing protein n=1 Tax=Tetracentron sinense TaxID=13715 RepID=A0A834Y983_TETSI|nr:hypothetical protein HHK36_031274 [Tetracentron sinense]
MTIPQHSNKPPTHPSNNSTDQNEVELSIKNCLTSFTKASIRKPDSRIRNRSTKIKAFVAKEGSKKSDEKIYLRSRSKRPDQADSIAVSAIPNNDNNMRWRNGRSGTKGASDKQRRGVAVVVVFEIVVIDIPDAANAPAAATIPRQRLLRRRRQFGLDMGAFAPISHWIPEDDLLLKNAVESGANRSVTVKTLAARLVISSSNVVSDAVAGASLESLAKGAVQFSRRFSVRELQDRWHSLLYDPDISAKASAHMVEFELSATNIPSKSNRSGYSKENELVPGKRKVESVRRHYYAMRKRNRNKPCNTIDLSFLKGPSVHNCTGNRGGCQEQLPLHYEPAVGNCMLGDHITNHFGQNFDIVHHAFPQMVEDAAAAADSIGGPAHAYHTGHCNSLEDVYGFVENVSPVSVEEDVGNGIRHSFEHNNVQKDIPHILGKDMSALGNCSGVEEMGSSQSLPMGNILEKDELEAKPLSTFNSINNIPGNVCSGFGGSQGFNSPVSDCSASFHQMGYSSPLPRMPIWKTIEDISAPAMPIDGSLGHKEQAAGDTLTFPDDDGKKINSSGCDVVHSESKMKDRMSGDEGDFAELSNSLLNFTNEEELLFMGVDEKDMMDGSCLDGLNSLLLSSPNDVHQDDIPSITEPKGSVASDTYLDIHGVACPGELGDIGDPSSSGHDDGHNFCDREVNVPSFTAAPNSHYPELCDGVICCTFNTEDPEIPYNDDFSSNQVSMSFASSVMQPNFEETRDPASSFAKDFCDNRKSSKRGLSLMKEGENPIQPFLPSQMIGLLPKIGPKTPNHLGGCYGVRSEFPEGESLAAASRHAVTACGEEITEVELGKHHDFDNSIDSFQEKPIHGSDHIKSNFRNSASGFIQEVDAPATILNHLSVHAESGSIEMAFPEPVVNPSTSDQEEQFSESDNDLPYYSDVEALILGMDLGPDVQDANFSKEVSRYQNEETKRAIIRLEQSAHSYMQRAIASHGAFAILRGRHLKHYIRKPKVLLGRATDDINVDIDLGREGRANTISRRQAIIKMDEDGSFYLRNLGKCSVFVNNKEVATGQRLGLSSSCLIEIRAMRFMFEMNQTSVRQYVANITQRNQEKSTMFEWSPEEVP